jgi:antitoxin component YwqK of YwqJK toxin-antitoxin module
MKKSFINLLLFFSSLIGHSQIGPNDDAVYLDSLENIGTEDNFKFIRVVKDFTQEKEVYEVSFFFRSGKIERKGTTSNKFFMTYEGPCVYYFENGNRKKIVNYVKNQMIGKQFEWHENGNIKSEKEIVLDNDTKSHITNIIHYWNSNNEQKVINGEGEYEELILLPKDSIIIKGQVKNYVKNGIWKTKYTVNKQTTNETYENGIFISGLTIDENGKKYPYNLETEKPQPRNGMADFYNFIGKNFITPNVPGLKGVIYLTFIIEKDGKITDIKILKDIGFGTGAEAIRVLSKYGHWLPGKQRGVPVRVMYSLPITIHG